MIEFAPTNTLTPELPIQGCKRTRRSGVKTIMKPSLTQSSPISLISCPSIKEKRIKSIARKSNTPSSKLLFSTLKSEFDNTSLTTLKFQVLHD